MNTDAVIRLIEIFARSRGLTVATVSTYASNHGATHSRLVAGHDLTTRRAERIAAWLFDHFDEWKRPNRAMFPWNGTYVMDARSECFLAFDKVADRRAELTAENVRYRLDCDRPDGIRQISWLALNYEGCLCWLPHYDEAKAEKTRMVAASEVPQLIAAGWRVLTEAEYADNQRTRNARDDRFAAFRLYVQHAPDDTPLGICPKQGDSGEWKHNADLFARLHAVEETIEVAAPSDMAAAIQAGDWAEVARLAAERAA